MFNGRIANTILSLCASPRASMGLFSPAPDVKGMRFSSTAGALSFEVVQPPQLAVTAHLSPCANNEDSGDKLVDLDAAERWAQAVKLFGNYDYDGSGTISHFALELEQLTLAICFKLSHDTAPVSADLINQACQAIDVEANPLDIEGYMAWLREQRVR